MATVDGGTLIGRILQEQDVKYMFGREWRTHLPLFWRLSEIMASKLIHMRHEQATAYAADGYARVTGKPGICCVTAGCGLTNAVTGLCGAGPDPIARSSVSRVSTPPPRTLSVPSRKPMARMW